MPDKKAIPTADNDMLFDIVRQTIERHDLLHRGDHIVLGLSGGPDSVCLFHVLQRLAGRMELHVHPVHINHRMRPEDAERDQAYAEKIAVQAGRPCRSFIVDCRKMAEKLGQTCEEAGRKARYDAFVQVAGEIRGNVIIAVAQNANDQAETILHRVIRGTGTDGLAGIAYRRYERGFPVIRPLLDVTREEIEVYCREQNLHPVLDHTNAQPIYTRNRIRLEILPMLETINENIVESLNRLGRIATADRAYLWEETERRFAGMRVDGDDADAGMAENPQAAGPSGPDCQQVVLDRQLLAEQPESLRRRIVLRAFQEIGLKSDVTEERLRAADEIIAKKQAPKTVEFPRGYRLTVARGKAIFMKPSQKTIPSALK